MISDVRVVIAPVEGDEAIAKRSCRSVAQGVAELRSGGSIVRVGGAITVCSIS